MQEDFRLRLKYRGYVFQSEILTPPVTKIIQIPEPVQVKPFIGSEPVGGGYQISCVDQATGKIVLHRKTEDDFDDTALFHLSLGQYYFKTQWDGVEFRTPLITKTEPPRIFQRQFVFQYQATMPD